MRKRRKRKRKGEGKGREEGRTLNLSNGREDELKALKAHEVRLRRELLIHSKSIIFCESIIDLKQRLRGARDNKKRRGTVFIQPMKLLYCVPVMVATTLLPQCQ